jgi:hypothetical protein
MKAILPHLFILKKERHPLHPIILSDDRSYHIILFIMKSRYGEYSTPS